jgi:hypothetical protein
VLKKKEKGEGHFLKCQHIKYVKRLTDTCSLKN